MVNIGRLRAQCGRFRANLAPIEQVRGKFDDSGHFLFRRAKAGRFGPDLAELCKIMANLSRNRPKFGRFGPKFAENAPKLPKLWSKSSQLWPESPTTEFAQSLTEFGQIWPESTSFGPASTKQSRPHSDQKLPRIDQCCQELDQHCWAQIRPRHVFPGVDKIRTKMAGIRPSLAWHRPTSTRLGPASTKSRHRPGLARTRPISTVICVMSAEVGLGSAKLGKICVDIGLDSEKLPGHGSKTLSLQPRVATLASASHLEVARGTRTP